MKKDSSISSLLGLTQQEAAALVGVHTSQWSMFESGKRSLPAAANQILATLLTAAKTGDMSAKGKSDSDRHEDERNKLLNRLLIENKYRLEMIRQKVNAARMQEEANNRRQRVADCLNKQTAAGKGEHPLYKTIWKKAEQARSKFNADLLKLELKQEVLEFEQRLIEFKLL